MHVYRPASVSPLSLSILPESCYHYSVFVIKCTDILTLQEHALDLPVLISVPRSHPGSRRCTCDTAPDSGISETLPVSLVSQQIWSQSWHRSGCKCPVLAFRHQRKEEGFLSVFYGRDYNFCGYLKVLLIVSAFWKVTSALTTRWHCAAAPRCPDDYTLNTHFICSSFLST